MADRVMREVRDHVEGRDGHGNALQAGQGVAHRAENGETERRAPFQRLKIAAHRHVVVDCRGDDRNEHHHAGHHAGADQPRRERSADQMVHPVPTVKKRERPKSQNTQIVTMDRTAEDFRDEVIGGGQPDRREPQSERVVPVPPVDRTLPAALDRLEVEQDVRRRIKPREPEKSGQKIPLAHVNVPGFAETEHEDGPHRNQSEGHEKHEAGVVRKFQPLDRAAVAGKDAEDPQQDADIPEDGRTDEQFAVPQRRAAETGHQPERRADAGRRGPPVNHRIEVRRPHPSEGQPAPLVE